MVAWEEEEGAVADSEAGVEEAQLQVREETHLLNNSSERPFELKFEIKHFGDKKKYGEKWKAKNKKKTKIWKHPPLTNIISFFL